MNTPFTFSNTVIGYSHIKKGTDTEDASAHYSDPQGRYYIAVISDGHGDKNCFRSSFGSKAVVSCTMEKLKLFAEGMLYSESRYEDFLSDKGIQQRTIKMLTDSIFVSWNEKIENDLRLNPPSEEEYEACSANVADMYRAGTRTSHIYGATLIAAIKIKDCLLLLQQGDGRCDVFYADGSVNQPIPWDENCHENVTTSMCDTDAHLRIRNCVFDTRKVPVIACYVGSDGVEDSFPNNDEIEQLGTHRFYKELTCHVIDLHTNEDEFYGFLNEHFSNLSRVGSADDVSVSGIVFIEQCRAFYQQFKNEVSAYELDFRIKDLESKIAVMGRKHSILKKRMDDEKKTYENAYAQYEKNKKELEKFEIRVASLTKEREDLEATYARNKNQAQTAQTEGSAIFSKLDFITEPFKGFLDQIRAALDADQKKIDALIRAEVAAYKKLEIDRVNLARFEANLQQYWQNYQKAKEEFDAFDETRKSYERELGELLAQKQALLDPASAMIFTDISSYSCGKGPIATIEDDAPVDEAPASETVPAATPIPAAPTIPAPDIAPSPSIPIVSSNPAPYFSVESASPAFATPSADAGSDGAQGSEDTNNG